MYIKCNEEYLYEIGKYASTNGPPAATRKLEKHFPFLNESTVRTFYTKVEADLKFAVSKSTTVQKALPKHQK